MENYVKAMTNLELTDYFIKKFTAIPEEEWTTGYYEKAVTHQKCVLGHCNYHHDTTTGLQLIKLFPEKSIVEINDGQDLYYSQPTPKQRILAALNDIRKTLV